MRHSVLAGVLVVVALSGVIVVRATRLASRQAPMPRAVRIEVDADRAARDLAGAIRIRTVSSDDLDRVDEGPFLALHDYLQAAFPLVHATLTRETVNKGSLLFAWRGQDPALEPAVFMAHLDVVPVDESGGPWAHAPFSGDIADGFVWGRGALDDKGNLIALLEGVERLVGEGFRPRRTIYLVCGHDEESGGTAGARRVVETLRGRGVSRFALVSDEGGLVGQGLTPGIGRPIALVGIAEKGYLNLELRVAGEGGHSSMPPAETSVGILSRALARLEATPFPSSLEEPTRQMFETLAPEMPFAMRLPLANLWLFEPLVVRQLMKDPRTAALLHTTVAPTVVRAGVKANVLAAEATAMVNLRLAPHDSIAGAVAFVRGAIGDDRVRIVTRGDASEPSRMSDTHGPAFDTVARTIRQVMPGDVVVSPMLLAAGTDSKYLAGVLTQRLPLLPVLVAPDDLGRFHGRNERIGVDALANSVRVLLTS